MDNHASLIFSTDRINIFHSRPAKYCSILEDLQSQQNIRHLEDQEWHHNGYPAHSHGDISTTLLCDDVYRAQEEHGPNYVVEHDQTQERHEDPQWHTHYLHRRQQKYYSIVITMIKKNKNNASYKFLFMVFIKVILFVIKLTFEHPLHCSCRLLHVFLS